MRRLILLTAVIGLIAAGCGGDDGIAVNGAWARNSPMMASAGAIYMNLEAGDTDRLVGASVDSSIAAVVEIHETAPADSGMEDGEDMGDDNAGEDGMEAMGGAMMMREVGEIALPAGEMVNLKPGGYHLMLLQIAEPLELGQKFDVTLTFENAGEHVVEVEVREEAP